MGLGQYDSLGVYCGPHTASSVFLILPSSGAIMAGFKGFYNFPCMIFYLFIRFTVVVRLKSIKIVCSKMK